MERAAVRNVFSRGAAELLDENIYKPANFQDFKQNLSFHRISFSTFTVLVARFVRTQAERAVASEAKFREQNMLEGTVKEKVRIPSPFTSCLPSPHGCLKKTKKKQRRKMFLFNTVLTLHLAQSAAQADIQTTVECKSVIWDKKGYKC